VVKVRFLRHLSRWWQRDGHRLNALFDRQLLEGGYVGLLQVCPARNRFVGLFLSSSKRRTAASVGSQSQPAETIIAKKASWPSKAGW